MVARLLEQYKNEVAPVLAKEFKHANAHSVPKLTKIVISMGLGRAIEDEAVLDAYGWPHDLSDEEILERLLALNLERAKE